MSIFQKLIIVILSWIVIFFIFVLFYPILQNSDLSKSKGKDYIIEHSSDLHSVDFDSFDNDSTLKIDIKNSYYTDVTLRLTSDSSYRVIYWGDRESWMWDIRKDFYFSVDIPYNRSKNIDVSKDIEILKAFKFGQVNVY